MLERITATGLLREAAGLYDDEATGLRRAAQGAWRGGFGSGGRWMQVAMEALRKQPLAGSRGSLQLLGLGKYAICLVAASTCLGLARVITPALALLAVPAFYAVESQMVFLFPVALDGSARPYADARVHTARAGGTLAVMRVVAPIAALMIFGGLVGRGFVRSWCLGCLAVCIWYDCVLARPSEKTPARLELGNGGRLAVREERVDGLALARPYRLLYVSDLHLGHRWTNPVADDVAAQAIRLRPDGVLLGGDLADRACGVGPLKSLVRRLAAVGPVYAIAGNHDRRAGLEHVRRAVETAGGTWLGREPVVVGELELHAAIGPGDADATRPRMLVAHDPSVFPQAAETGYALVVAGHLHGGQCVLATIAGRAYPGALLSRWTGLRFVCNGSTLLVSRGAADTLPVRWNCPREVILCTLS